MAISFPRRLRRPLRTPVQRGFLTRLASDTRGTTLAMMGAFLIPLSALAGSAVDMARLYVVKVRLQQACDAGVLAGRKFMISSNDPLLDTGAATQAQAFFTNNFNSGWMKTTAVAFTPTKTVDQQVAGTAVATVPMTVMKMFGSTDKTLNVTCEARFDVADTDIIFVLDTTGSMSCLPSETDAQCQANLPAAVTYTRPTTAYAVAGYSGSTGHRVPERMSAGVNASRIAALRTAVTDFYSTLASHVDPSTNIRYGFVTYASMVNAGKDIMDVSPSYIVGGSGSGSWTYQSRENTGDYATGVSYALNGKTQANCTSNVRTPATKYTASGTASRVQDVWYEGNCYTATINLGPVWQYKPVTYDVSSYVAGNAIQNPTVAATSMSNRWFGCLEERNTTAGQTTFDINNLPPDLDPDLVPSNDNTRWRPLWPDVTYTRSTHDAYPSSNGDSGSHPVYTGAARAPGGFAACGKPTQRLKVMSATDVSNYVNAVDFVPHGGTYHDIGMIWGLRLLSPTGLFKNDTSAWPGRQAPRRIIVFMTDGSMAPNNDVYGMYGIERTDRRIRNGAGTPTPIDFHNARFLAACSKAKAMNIDVWTVAIAPAEDANLKACATIPAQAFFTTSGTGLSTHFRRIAQQIAMLRVSK